MTREKQGEKEEDEVLRTILNCVSHILRLYRSWHRRSIEFSNGNTFHPELACKFKENMGH